MTVGRRAALARAPTPAAPPERLDAGDAWMWHMRRGDLAAAWALADGELAKPRPPDAFTRPRHLQRIWDGRPIEGRRVLVRCYHGLGDTIQFARFLPALANRARSVTVWAQPALLPLLATLDERLHLLPLHDGAPDVAYDVDVEIMELAWVLRATLETLPRRVPYLHVTPRPIAAATSLRVAVVWQAGAWNAARSIPTELVARLTAVPGVTCIATHPSAPDGDSSAWPGDWQPCDTVLALAQLVAAMDLVVSVDTMCAHLAGALGVPVWTLLPYDADWRWMADRDDSPWYPTMRLFRQPSPGDWTSPLAAVTETLHRAAEFPAAPERAWFASRRGEHACS
jgi:hypothetical protein